MLSTGSASYTKTAKALHWLIALAIICMLILGWSFDYLPNGSMKFALIQLHKSVGITILLLSFARLAWRLMHQAPPLPATMPVWEHYAAHAGHFILYVLMIGMPLTGWAMVSSSPRNIPTIFYGLFVFPPLPGLATVENKQEVSHFFSDAHSYIAFVFAATIAGHAAAALRHHFILRDGVLLRMTPNFCARFLNRLRRLS